MGVAEAGVGRRWWRDPLVHFLALGLVVLGIHDALAAPTPVAGARLELSDSARAELRERFEEQHARPPTQAEVAAQAERWLDEEALLRRAYELGLDRSDTIVRRRLIQRMRFVLEDTKVLAEPREGELEAYLAENVERYRLPTALTFEHRFFSRASRATALEVEAQAAMDALRKEASAEVGADAFFGGARFDEEPLTAIKRLFGTEFADAIAKLPAGQWAGPIRSAYGLHLVRVVSRKPGPAPRLDDVRKRVLVDWKRDRREARNREALDELRRRYGAPAAGDR